MLRALRRDRPLQHIPVLMLTARHLASDVQKAVAAGANDYLTKPFDDKLLLQRVAPPPVHQTEATFL